MKLEDLKQATALTEELQELRTIRDELGQGRLNHVRAATGDERPHRSFCFETEGRWARAGKSEGNHAYFNTSRLDGEASRAIQATLTAQLDRWIKRAEHELAGVQARLRTAGELRVVSKQTSRSAPVPA